MLDFAPKASKVLKQYSYIVGCDEVGRGCLAGPVVAASVAFHTGLKIKDLRLKLGAVRDSKLLTPLQRQNLSAQIKNAAAWSVGVVSPKLVDHINIHYASLRAMSLSVNRLRSLMSSSRMRGSSSPSSEQLSVGHGADLDSDLSRDGSEFHSVQANRLHGNDNTKDARRCYLFVDGKFKIPDIDIDQQAIVDGDAKIFSVACASIIAKVYRDELMRKLHVKLPQYGFANHKGYATLEHRSAIMMHGLSEHHRRSFCVRYL